MRALLLAVLLTACAAVLTACPGPTFVVQQYAGPTRPRESIATLRVRGDESIRLLFLDQEDVAAPIASDARLHIEMLPGRHTLTARDGEDRTRSGSVVFQAEPGKVYRILFVGDDPRLFEVDRDSDRPIRDVTLAPEAPRAPLLTPPVPSPAPPPAPDDDAGAEEDAGVVQDASSPD